MPGQHAVFAPSKLGTIRRCPGYINHNKDRPEGKSGDAAIDGTHTHTLIGHCIQAGQYNALTFDGIKLQDAEGVFQVDIERCHRANVLLNYLLRRLQELQQHNPKVYSEIQSNPGGQVRRDDWHGTCDIFITWDEGEEVIDYKDGYADVAVEDNDQLFSYILGLIPLSKLQAQENRDKAARLTIVQPKTNQQPKISEVTYWKLLTVYDDLIDVINAALDSSAPRRPGDHCKWCPGKLDCPERLEEQRKAAVVAFSGIDLPVEQKPVLAAIGITMDNETLSTVLDAAPIVREWLEECEDEALRRFKSGQQVPRYKTVHANTKRRWIEDREKVIKILKGKRLGKADIFEEKLRGLGAILKNEKLNEKQVKDIEAKAITKPQGVLVVVPESDKRPAVHLDAKTAFDKAPTIKQLEAPTEISFL